MKNIKYFTFIIFIIIYISCKRDINSTKDIDSLKLHKVDTIKKHLNAKENTIKEVTITDTIVVFFYPSNKQRQELIKYYGMYDQYDFIALFNNFTILAEDTKNSLKKHKIITDISHANRFIFPTAIDTFIYDINFEDQIMGYILADGVNYPLIKNGVQLPKDISLDIRNYFNLKNFSIYGE
jgi:hypothetical protein